MSERPLRVLLIEDDPSTAVLVEAMMTAAAETTFEFLHADTLLRGLAAISESRLDGIILDLTLPDSCGLETFNLVHVIAPSVPILVLSGCEDESVAIEAVARGAQDYFVKNQVNGAHLVRAFQLSIERKSVEKELRESEARLRDISEAASDWMWETNTDCQLTFASARLRKLVELEPSAKRDSRHGEGSEAGSMPELGWLRQVPGFAAKRPFRDVRYSTVGPNGATHHFKVSGVPFFGDDGVFLGYRGTGTDVTAEVESTRRAQEAEMRITGIAENLPGVIFQRLLHRDGRVEYPFVSAHAAALVGQSATAIATTPEVLFGAVHEDDRSQVEGAFVRSAGDLESVALEYRVVAGDGRVKWVRCGARARRTDDDGVVWDGLLLDVTDRKTLEMQLVQAQKLEALGQLAAGIAHEINTPTQYVGDNARFLGDAFSDLLGLQQRFRALLTAAREDRLSADILDEVEGAIDTADLDYLADEIPRAVDQALEGTRRISTIVRAMKEFSHPGGEEKECVNLNHIIESTVTVARNEWKYVADLETQLDEELPWFDGYPAELGQAFLNLVVNAAHAIGELGDAGAAKKGRIVVETRYTRDAAEVRVSDSGPGVPEAIRERIFDPFFTTKEVGKGTGQGLAIARAVVVRHGGTLQLEDGHGEGTTFLVRLPLSGAAEAQPRSAA